MGLMYDKDAIETIAVFRNVIGTIDSVGTLTKDCLDCISGL